MVGLRKRRRRLVGLVGLVGIAAVGALLAAALRGGVRRYVVSGESMAPTLRPGDFLLVARVSPRILPVRPGWIVVARRPDRPEVEIIKRVGDRVDAERSGVRLVGDNRSGSTDSREFGAAPREFVIGVAVWRYWPPRRFGRMR